MPGQFPSPGGLVHRRREEIGPDRNRVGDVERDHDSAGPLEHRHDGPPLTQWDATTEEVSSTRCQKKEPAWADASANAVPPRPDTLSPRSAGPQVRCCHLPLPTLFEVVLDLLAFDDLVQL